MSATTVNRPKIISRLPDLRVGELAYYWAYPEPVPCRILTVSGSSPVPTDNIIITALITQSKHPHTKGEIIQRNSLYFLPKSCGGGYSLQYSVNLNQAKLKAVAGGLQFSQFLPVTLGELAHWINLEIPPQDLVDFLDLWEYLDREGQSPWEYLEGKCYPHLSQIPESAIRNFVAEQLSKRLRLPFPFDWEDESPGYLLPIADLLEEQGQSNDAEMFRYTINEVLRRPKSIRLIGRRWWCRNKGHTISSFEIFLDEKQIVKSMPWYGYGNHCLYEAVNYLKNNNLLPGLRKCQYTLGDYKETIHEYCERLDIQYEEEVFDVKRKRDL